MSDETEDAFRARIVAEALTWQRTKYRHHQRVKGAGVDCLMIIVAVYESVGAISNIDVPFYQQQFNLHNNEETYINGILRFAHEVDAPKPGDIVLYRVGRKFAHAAIVIDWPTVIHAAQGVGVVLEDAEKNAGLTHIDVKGNRQIPRPRKFFSFW